MVVPLGPLDLPSGSRHGDRKHPASVSPAIQPFSKDTWGAWGPPANSFPRDNPTPSQTQIVTGRRADRGWATPAQCVPHLLDSPLAG